MSSFDIDLLRKEVVEIKETIAGAKQKGRTLSEADTERLIIYPILKALGYHHLEVWQRERDSTTGTFPDYTLLDGTPYLWFIEAKRLDLPLNDREAMQAVAYATNHGAKWAILSNGRTWYFYLAHLQKPLTEKRVFQIDDLFADDSGEAVDCLALLSRTSMTSDGLEAAWTTKQLNMIVRSELFTPSSQVRQTLERRAKEEIGAYITDGDIGRVINALVALKSDERDTHPPSNQGVTDDEVGVGSPSASPIPSLSSTPTPSELSESSPLPLGDWKTMYDLRRDPSLTEGRSPVRVLLGESDIQSVKSWSDVSQKIVGFLGGEYGLPPLPMAFQGRSKRYFLNTQPVRADGESMRSVRDIVVSGQKVYIDTNLSAPNHVGSLYSLLKAVNAPFDAVHVEVTPEA